MKPQKYVTGLLAASMIIGMLGGCGDSGNSRNSSTGTPNYGENVTTTAVKDTDDTTSTEEAKEEFNVFSSDTRKKTQTIEQLINDNFYFDIDSDTRERIYYLGLLAGLGDPYSTYFTKEQMEAIAEDDSGEYMGIGVVVSKNMETGIIYVVKPMRGSPALEAGLQPDDMILAIDDEDLTTATTLEEASKKIRGSSKTKAKLKVYREGEPDYLYFEIERRIIQNISVEYEMLENGFGYILVNEFVENTYDQFKEAVDYVTEKGAKALILDLRDNPGGFTYSAYQMLDYLIKDDSVAKGENESTPGLLFYLKYKNGKRENYPLCQDGHSVELPMAVLVNGNTASSSEIMAGVLQDYKKGILVGTTTYGKGIVQITYPLEDGSGVKLTVASYFLPSGRGVTGDGLTPDVEATLDSTIRRRMNIKHSEDTQLAKAIEELGGEPLPKEP